MPFTIKHQLGISQQAAHLDEVATYLELCQAVNAFGLGEMRGPRHQRHNEDVETLRRTAAWIRRAPHFSEPWPRQTRPPEVILHIVVSRLWQLFMDLTQQPCFRVMTALIQTAPYTPPYQHYADMTLEQIQSLFAKRGGPPWPY